MAEPLKNAFGESFVRKIATMVSRVHPAFPSARFTSDSLEGLEALSLTDRARHVMRALRQHLPPSYPEAIEILIRSLGPEMERSELNGMDVFVYLPHVFFVAEYGLDHFEPSMRAQYELTKRFTAEFSIRAYLQHHQEKTLARLKEWALDPNVHVRRLVSEGSRPRLPWAARLKEFQRDPKPVLELLDLLKDDPELYVRRSVANNLNDIGKDHPELLAETCRRWSDGATPERKWLIRHALRSAVKRGHAGAMEVMGAGAKPHVAIEKAKVAPRTLRIGEKMSFSFELVSEAKRRQNLIVDFQVHYVKANGETRAKVFKLSEVELPAGGRLIFQKSLSFEQRTTRVHYPGLHKVEVLVNGQAYPLGKLELRA
jgi:3-methyladenine DNA glycosylase AlkC